MNPDETQKSKSATGPSGTEVYRRRSWLPYAGAALLVALIVAGLWPTPTPVETARAVMGPLRTTITEEGKTRIKDRYQVSAPVSGHLRRIQLKAGDAVEAGRTLIAVVDPISSTMLDPRGRATAAARRMRPLRTWKRRAPRRYLPRRI